MSYHILSPTHIVGDLTVTGSVTCNVSAAPSRSLTEFRFSALNIEERDGWFGVPVEVVNAVHGKTMAGMQHVEVERRVKLWLADNVEHKHVVLQTSVQFKHEDDAVAFYLRFSGGVSFEE